MGDHVNAKCSVHEYLSICLYMRLATLLALWAALARCLHAAPTVSSPAELLSALAELQTLGNSTVELSAEIALTSASVEAASLPLRVPGGSTLVLRGGEKMRI